MSRNTKNIGNETTGEVEKIANPPSTTPSNSCHVVGSPSGVMPAMRFSSLSSTVVYRMRSPAFSSCTPFPPQRHGIYPRAIWSKSGRVAARLNLLSTPGLVRLAHVGRRLDRRNELQRHVPQSDDSNNGACNVLQHEVVQHDRPNEDVN